MTNIQKLNESGLARTLGVSRQAVHDLVSRGILTKDKDGQIDVEMAKIALLNRVRPSSKTGTALQRPIAEIADAKTIDENTEITSFHVAKTLREACEAQLARLKLSEARGELIRVDAVKAAVANVFSATRDALLQLPARLGPQLAAESDPAAAQNMLHAEIHQALQLLAEATERVAITEAAAP